MFEELLGRIAGENLLDESCCTSATWHDPREWSPTFDPVQDLAAQEVETPTALWHCAYCGQSNAAEREGCRGCQAPRPEVM